MVVKIDDLVNLIREKSGIPVDDFNRGKNNFFKEELLTIVAYINMLEQEVKRNGTQEKLIKDVVNEVFNQTITN